MQTKNENNMRKQMKTHMSMLVGEKSTAYYWRNASSLSPVPLQNPCKSCTGECSSKKSNMCQQIDDIGPVSSDQDLSFRCNHLVFHPRNQFHQNYRVLFFFKIYLFALQRIKREWALDIFQPTCGATCGKNHLPPTQSAVKVADRCSHRRTDLRTTLPKDWR